ncbi:iron efflux ABC transporter ATP-binding subunit FetA [Rouxiella chamberiensis]|uniref:Iron ABC transporter ATP-binding protein FetA n=1 Tax=Rouxiella chamberiensis TaxID=1513468 RepID=A0ABY7HSB6_9GAMM|nr:iron ABC transporter ATP-binding protein FetA [Rouxiella chamberiensis]WAT02294.1 iron ABC transporter ATP-binding protein FetA [Rouxiella chamberiensis]
MSLSSALLRVQDVSFSLDGNLLLQPTSFDLARGEFLLLTGPSGCGKSTLLKILSSLQDPTNGQIFLEDKNIRDIKPELYRQQVSYCFQTPVLFGQTVEDNLALPYQIRGKRPDRKRLAEWLTRVNLSADMLDKEVNSLSGGEKQRVALLRNLQFLPKVLLLDEVTSALDEENRQTVNALVAEWVKQEGLAVIWVTHDSNEIRHAQRVITLTRNDTGERPDESA